MAAGRDEIRAALRRSERKDALLRAAAGEAPLAEDPLHPDAPASSMIGISLEPPAAAPGPSLLDPVRQPLRQGVPTGAAQPANLPAPPPGFAGPPLPDPGPVRGPLGGAANEPDLTRTPRGLRPLFTPSPLRGISNERRTLIKAAMRMKEGRMDPKQFAAEWLENDGFGDLDVSKLEPVDAATRSVLSIMGDTDSEKQVALRKWWGPEAELVTIPATEFVVARKSPSHPPQRFDLSSIEAFFDQPPGGFPKEVLGDLADVTAEATIVLGEAIPAFLMRKPAVKGGGYMLRQILAQAYGAGSARAAREGGQKAFGSSLQSGEEVLGEMGFEATASFLGGGVGSIIGKATDTAFRRGLFPASEIGVRAMDEAAELGMNVPGRTFRQMTADIIMGRGRDTNLQLMPFQATDTKAVSGAGKQALAANQRLNAVVRLQNIFLLKRVREGGKTFDRFGKEVGESTRPDPKLVGDFMDESRRLMERANKSVVDTVSHALRLVKNTPDARREMGMWLTETVGDWWKTQSASISRMFDDARSLGSPEFNIVELRGQIDEVLRPVTGRGIPFPVTTVDPATGQATTRMLQNEVALTEASPLMATLVRKLRSLDDVIGDEIPGSLRADGVPVQTSNVVDQLKALRREASAASVEVAERGSRKLNADAAKVVRLIQDMLDNPSNSDQAFVDAWRKATRAKHEQYLTREQIFIAEAASTGAEKQTPGRLAAQLLHPHDELVDRLAMLEKVLEPDEFNRVMGMWKAELFENRTLTEALSEAKRYDSGSLHRLMPGTEMAALERGAGLEEALAKSGMARALKEQDAVRPFIKQVLADPSTVSLGTLHDLVRMNGGPDSPYGKTVRAAIFDEFLSRAGGLWDDATEQWVGEGVEKGGYPFLHQGKSRTTWLDFKNRKLTDLLLPEERADMEKILRVNRFTIQGGENVGDSMSTGLTSAGMRNPTQRSVAVRLISFWAYGRQMTSRAGRRFWLGDPHSVKTGPGWGMTLLGSIGGTILKDLGEGGVDVFERLDELGSGQTRGAP